MEEFEGREITYGSLKDASKHALRTIKELQEQVDQKERIIRSLEHRIEALRRSLKNKNVETCPFGHTIGADYGYKPECEGYCLEFPITRSECLAIWSTTQKNKRS